MAPDYRPKFKKQSQAEALAEFDGAMDWLETLPGVSSIGRFQTYRDNLSKVFRLTRLAEKLRRVVDGQPYTSALGKKTEPGEILFELELATLLKEWGLRVDLGNALTPFAE